MSSSPNDDALRSPSSLKKAKISQPDDSDVVVIENPGFQINDLFDLGISRDLRAHGLDVKPILSREVMVSSVQDKLHSFVLAVDFSVPAVDSSVPTIKSPIARVDSCVLSIDVVVSPSSVVEVHVPAVVDIAVPATEVRIPDAIDDVGIPVESTHSDAVDNALNVKSAIVESEVNRGPVNLVSYFDDYDDDRYYQYLHIPGSEGPDSELPYHDMNSQMPKDLPDFEPLSCDEEDDNEEVHSNGVGEGSASKEPTQRPSSRFGKATAEDYEEVAKGGPRRSIHCERWAMRAFDAWRIDRGASIDKSIADMSEDEDLSILLELLVQFFLEVKKQDGTMYSPNM